MGKKKKELPVTYGGQAVMEGVMMRGREYYCVAVRNPQGEIESQVGKSPEPSRFVKVAGKIPIFRGMVNLVRSLLVGYKVLESSAKMAGLEEEVENPSKFDTWLENKLGDKLASVMIVVALIISLGFSVALFMVLPTWLSSLLPIEEVRLLGVVEGLVRLVIFVGYLLLISRLRDVKRFFAYHGAEHMAINTYEAKEELTVENARKHSRLHRRCGTSFLMFVMLISMIFFLFVNTVFLFVNTNVVWLRVLSRILFVPFIAGISFEVIRWAGISKSPIVKILSWPGFMMQRITTAQPDDAQLAVAIVALEGVLTAELDEGREFTVSELRAWGRAELATVFNDEDEISTDVDSLLMLATKTNSFNDFLLKLNENTTFEERSKFRGFIDRRKRQEPVQYIIGGWVFMSSTLELSRDVLIPRNDTETLVNAVLSREPNFGRGLEIGVGSGAVSIALKKHGEHDMSGTDICLKAVQFANKNFAKIFDGVEPFVQGDLFENVTKGIKFDFIVSNPPYIPTADIADLSGSVKDFEPHVALDGGEDGLDFFRRISAEAGQWLLKSGGLYFEIGSNQGEDVKNIMTEAGFIKVDILQDLSQNDRVVHGRLKS